MNYLDAMFAFENHGEPRLVNLAFYFMTVNPGIRRLH